MVMDSGRNLTQQVVHSLGMDILNGRYPPNAALPSEAELSEMFGVSRSATREAVKMLAAKGLLSSRPRQGIRILPESEWNLFDTDVLHWLLASRPNLLLLRDFIQMRISIEPEAAALAAQLGDEERIAGIGAALERMRLAEQGMEDPLEADIAFHTAILSASGNRFLTQLRAFCATALRFSIRHTNQIKGVTAADVSDHQAIYVAIREGQSEKARVMMRDMQEEALSLLEAKIAKVAA